jgi:hypothetical protein
LILGGKGGYHLLNGGVNGSQCQCTTPLNLRLQAFLFPIRRPNKADAMVTGPLSPSFLFLRVSRTLSYFFQPSIFLKQFMKAKYLSFSSCL